MRLSRLALPAAGLLLTVVAVHQARGTAPAPAAAPAPPRAADPRVVAEGRVVAYPGAEITVAAETGGLVERLAVEEKQAVKKGQLVAELRADDLRASLAEARARVAEADADVRLYGVEVERAERLAALGVQATRDADLARRNRDAAAARRETATAAVRRLEADLAKTRIVAPIDGVVTRKAVEAGEYVDKGDAVVTVVDLARTRVEAEVDEFDAGRIALGSAATLTAEGWVGSRWRGSVEEIPDQVLPRQLDPQDPGRPSDTRVLKVKVAFAEPTPLKLGQRVEVSLAVR